MTFLWSDWVINHKGPLQAYMAPYEGDISNQDIHKLKFFKIGEEGYNAAKHQWASDRLMVESSKWDTSIPWDIKPGKYVVRHEMLALHFATGNLGRLGKIPGDEIPGLGKAGPQVWVLIALFHASD
jgi:hypothetical protein